MWSSSVKTGEQLSISGISAKDLAKEFGTPAFTQQRLLSAQRLAVGLKIAELELMYAQEANLLLPWLLA